MRRSQGFTQTLPHVIILYEKKSRFYSNSSRCHYVVWEEVKVLLKFFHMSLCCMRRSQGFTQTLPYVIMLYEEVKVLLKFFHTSLCSMRRSQGFTQTLPYVIMLYEKKLTLYSNFSICPYVAWEEVKVLHTLFHISLCSMCSNQGFTQTLPHVIILYEKKLRFYSNSSDVIM